MLLCSVTDVFFETVLRKFLRCGDHVSVSFHFCNYACRRNGITQCIAVNQAVLKRNEEFAEKSKSLGVDDSLKTISGLDQDMILSLAEHGVKTLDDLADLAADELIEILGDGVITEVEANRVIMAAREHWFADEEKN